MNATATLFAINGDLVGEKLTPIFIDGKNEIALCDGIWDRTGATV